MLRPLLTAAAVALCVLPVSGCGGDGDSYACPPPIFYQTRVFFPRPVDDTFVVGEALGEGDAEECEGAGSDDFPTGDITVYRVPGVKPQFGFAATLDGQRYYFAADVDKGSRACQRAGVICD